MTDSRPYVGSELTLFAHARNWKQYQARVLGPYIGRRVLEVGAGLGATTEVICTGVSDRWVCLEPDPSMAAALQARRDRGELPRGCEVLAGTLSTVPASETFDTILYLDVLEHIEDDGQEMAKAASLLAPGGVLAVVAPAHNSLYSPFDKAIGHYRRYDKETLLAVAPGELRLEQLSYLDSAGLAASAANKFFLGSASPTMRQIMFWDNVLVRLSLVTDVLTGHLIGKSILGAWRKVA